MYDASTAGRLVLFSRQRKRENNRGRRADDKDDTTAPDPIWFEAVRYAVAVGVMIVWAIVALRNSPQLPTVTAVALVAVGYLLGDKLLRKAADRD